MNYLCFDVGGTVIKFAALINGKLSARGESPALSHENAGTVLANFASAIDCMLQQTEEQFDSLRFAFPGDFDYKNGICLIKGVNKYESLYKMNLKQYFNDYMRQYHKSRISADFDCVFVNDVSAVAMGAAAVYPQNAERAIVLCIGTGCGSAYLLGGNIATNGKGIPPNGWVYPLPFKGSIYDDYLSVRGFGDICRGLAFSPPNGKAAADAAAKGDKTALAAFDEFGSQLAEGIAQLADLFKPKSVFLGGGIMQSYEYLRPAIEQEAKRYSFDITVIPDTSLLAFNGLAK